MKKECCDECGTALIDMCYQCGAPVCCPRCCAIDTAVREAVEAERGRHPRMKRIPADHIEWNEWDGYFVNDMVTRPDWAHREAWLLSDMEGYWIEQPTGDDDE